MVPPVAWAVAESRPTADLPGIAVVRLCVVQEVVWHTLIAQSPSVVGTFMGAALLSAEALV